MNYTRRTTRPALLAAAITLALPASGFAQERVGIVTSVEGTVTVARAALRAPQPIRFKDDVLLHDRITTGERSIVRVLLGGKATVTARERSVVTITEVPGRSTVELGEGRIAVAVSRGLMKPGEIVEIKTPNAVSAIRGTVVVAEVSSGATVQSTITVLRGLVDVTQLELTTRRRVGLPVDVGALQAVTVTGSLPPSRPIAISPGDARRLTSEFRGIPRVALPAVSAAAVQEARRQAVADVKALTPAPDVAGRQTHGQETTSGRGSNGGNGDAVGDSLLNLNAGNNSGNADSESGKGGGLLNVGLGSGGEALPNVNSGSGLLNLNLGGSGQPNLGSGSGYSASGNSGSGSKRERKR